MIYVCIYIYIIYIYISYINIFHILYIYIIYIYIYHEPQLQTRSQQVSFVNGFWQRSMVLANSLLSCLRSPCDDPVIPQVDCKSTAAKAMIRTYQTSVIIDVCHIIISSQKYQSIIHILEITTMFHFWTVTHQIWPSQLRSLQPSLVALLWAPGFAPKPFAGPRLTTCPTCCWELWSAATVQLMKSDYQQLSLAYYSIINIVSIRFLWYIHILIIVVTVIS